MSYRKKTLRKMPPVTRDTARLVNDLESLARKLRNRLATIQELEIDSIALRQHRCDVTIPRRGEDLVI